MIDHLKYNFDSITKFSDCRAPTSPIAILSHNTNLYTDLFDVRAGMPRSRSHTINMHKGRAKVEVHQVVEVGEVF